VSTPKLSGRWRLVIALVVFAMVAVACGDDDAGDTTTTAGGATTTTAAAPTTTEAPPAAFTTGRIFRTPPRQLPGLH
jgi:hypothetical protein